MLFHVLIKLLNVNQLIWLFNFCQDVSQFFVERYLEVYELIVEKEIYNG